MCVDVASELAGILAASKDVTVRQGLLAAIKKKQRLHHLAPLGRLVPIDALDGEAVQIAQPQEDRGWIGIARGGKWRKRCPSLNKS
jgi:hypothetical protein